MKAIIIGATSGIGRELARQMSKDGYILGLAGRRTHLLDSLQAELPSQCFTSCLDLTNITESVRAFNELLKTMECGGEDKRADECVNKGVDIVIINSGVGSADPEYPLSDELQTVAVNVAGFTAMANLAYHYFSEKKSGHIVGISSVAAVKGGLSAPYHASKAYVSNYLEGLSCRSHVNNNNIIITDIRPGFVDTDMAKGDGVFWKAPVEKAAKQIIDAIQKKRRVVYVTKRWRIIGLLLGCLPFTIYRKFIR